MTKTKAKKAKAAARTHKPEPTVDDLNDLRLSIAREADRGMTLSIAAFIDDQLAALLRTVLLHLPQTDQLLGSGPAHPLGSFSARTNAARAMGIISEQQYLEINVLRDVRNVFAHNWRISSLADPALADLVLKMKGGRWTADHAKLPEGRARFEQTCVSLLVELHIYTNQLRNTPEKARISLGAYHLS